MTIDAQTLRRKLGSAPDWHLHAPPGRAMSHHVSLVGDGQRQGLAREGGESFVMRIKQAVLLLGFLLVATSVQAGDLRLVERSPAPEDRKLTTPADERYDAAGLVLPESYPAKSDDPQALIARLVRWGGVQVPRRLDIEEEFGLRFVDGFARGRPPLGDWLSSASGSDVLSSLLLSFQNRPTLAEAARLAPLRRNICVDSSALARAFEADGWTLRIRQGGPHGGEELRFTKHLDAGIRQVSFAPLDQTFRSDATGNCLDVIQYIFELS